MSDMTELQCAGQIPNSDRRCWRMLLDEEQQWVARPNGEVIDGPFCTPCVNARARACDEATMIVDACGTRL